MGSEINGAEITVQALIDLGVEVVFGYPGGAVLPIYDALFQQNRIRHILVRHEQGAIHAAQGYARSSGRVGIVFATSGPGATNLVTGLADAQIDMYIDKIKTAQNFYVCARLLEDFDVEAIEIKLSVNDAQQKVFRLVDGRVINVGIINPMIFPGQKNHFKAEIYFIDADGIKTKPAPNAILISHFVIDDKVVMSDQIRIEFS
jgi:hypothetical protein